MTTQSNYNSRINPRNWHKDQKAGLTPGERAADRLRNGMGSWTFVFSFVLFMVVWATLNTIHGLHHWDSYPFILLNLFLSMLAGLQGAILLIAAKRQDSISAAMAEHDYQTNVAAKHEIELLASHQGEQLALLQDMQKQLQALQAKLDAQKK